MVEGDVEVVCVELLAHYSYELLQVRWQLVYTYMCICMCVCKYVHVCVCKCIHVCVCGCVGERESVCIVVGDMEVVCVELELRAPAGPMAAGVYISVH